jgi:putative membrane protein
MPDVNNTTVNSTTLPTEHHATEFLANERTFLAWVRTSIAVISLGFAVTKFDLWLKEIAKSAGVTVAHRTGWSMPMGLTLIILGGLLPVFAAWRYHVVNQQIEQGSVRADRAMILMVTLLIVALALVFVLYFLKSSGIW